MKKIKIAIIVIISILVIVIGTFILVKTFNKDEKKPIDNGEKAYIELSNKAFKVKSETVYFTVESIAQMIIDKIHQEDKEFVFNTLNKDYIIENNLDENNVLENFTKIENSQIFNVIDMYENDYNSSNKVFLKGQGVDENNNEQIYYIIIRLNNINSTFDFEFIDEDEYKEEIEKNKADENINITKNEYNKFNVQSLSTKSIASKYLLHYKNLLLNDSDRAYEMLDEKYKQAKFPNKKDFENYINENLDKIKKIYLNNYVKTSEDNKDMYICNDRYNCCYIFKINEVMNYKVQLDSYTLDNEYFTSEYKKKNNKYKAAMNVEKFIEMINMKDYKSIYNVLADSFIKKYSITEKSCKNIINEIFYDGNKLTSASAEKRGDYYIIKAEVTNENKYNESKNINFIVNLKEGTDFELSFSADE